MTDKKALEFIILGCGSSGGVPRVDGNWGVCNPENPKNTRTRCSVAVRLPSGAIILIDTSPDLRFQVLREKINRVDAIFYTHDHADQVHGIDDVRAFTYRDKKRIPCYADPATAQVLKHRFDYIFLDNLQGGYPALMDLHIMPEQLILEEGVLIKAYECVHGKITALGYQINDVFYSPDVNMIADDVLKSLTDANLSVWVVDCLRYTPHPTHANLEQVLKWHKQVKPQKMILTNLHFDMDYDILSSQLPDNIIVAYDGLRFRNTTRTKS